MTWPDDDTDPLSGPGDGPAETGSETGDDGDGSAAPLPDDESTGETTWSPTEHAPLPGGYDGPGGYVGTDEETPSEFSGKTMGELTEAADGIKTDYDTGYGTSEYFAGTIDPEYEGTDLAESILAWAEQNSYIANLASGITTDSWDKIKNYQQIQSQFIRNPAMVDGEERLRSASDFVCDDEKTAPESLEGATHYLNLEAAETDTYKRLTITTGNTDFIAGKITDPVSYTHLTLPTIALV